MKSFLFLLCTFLSIAIYGQSSFERKGFFLGSAFGAGVLTLSSSLIGENTQTGATFPNLKAGTMVSENTAAVLLLPGTVYAFKWGEEERARGFEGFFPSVQHWVADRWWILGGAGLGMDAPAFYDIKDKADRKFYFGPAAVAGTGFEIFRKGPFALDLQGRVHYARINAPEGKREGLAFNFMVGITRY